MRPGRVVAPTSVNRGRSSRMLRALGLSPQEASEAMAGLANDGHKPIEDLLREALQHVGMRA